MKELLLLRIEGAMDALEEPYRGSLPRLLMLGLGGGSIIEGAFSVTGVDSCGDGAEVAGFLALK